MSKNCRRKNLVSYFNPDEATSIVCNACDSCKGMSTYQSPTVDYTPQIIQIIEFIQGTEKPVTVKYLAQVVSGKLNKKVKNNGDQHSQIFGILKCTVNASERFL